MFNFTYFTACLIVYWNPDPRSKVQRTWQRMISPEDPVEKPGSNDPEPLDSLYFDRREGWTTSPACGFGLYSH